MPNSPAIKYLAIETITAEAFAPFGQLITPQADGKPFDMEDAQLHLSNGTPRFYLMQLKNRGRQFHTITHHKNCTQCLGALGSKDWFIAVAPPNEKDRNQSTENSPPDQAHLKAFKIPGNSFIKLERGTWHAGPFFDHKIVDFYNLELSDTNVVDHHSYNFLTQEQLTFEFIDL